MKHEEMVRDGIYYAAALIVAGLGLTYVASWFVALPMFLLAAFCLYFFRDPNRTVPDGAVAVSPADGRVVSLKATDAGGTRVSIFLNIFDVHVNRTPIAGKITDVEYQPGRFLVASREDASTANEQNVITVEGDGTRVVFKQIAGLIARRIVCWTKTGDVVRAGERIGLIKFGSRVDVFFGPEWDVTVNVRERVSGGSSVIARRKREQ
jgi:phosphatidylserine decarboxylase